MRKLHSSGRWRNKMRDYIQHGLHVWNHCNNFASNRRLKCPILIILTPPIFSLTRSSMSGATIPPIREAHEDTPNPRFLKKRKKIKIILLKKYIGKRKQIKILYFSSICLLHLCNTLLKSDVKPVITWSVVVDPRNVVHAM